MIFCVYFIIFHIFFCPCVSVLSVVLLLSLSLHRHLREFSQGLKASHWPNAQDACVSQPALQPATSSHQPKQGAQEKLLQQYWTSCCHVCLLLALSIFSDRREKLLFILQVRRSPTKDTKVSESSKSQGPGIHQSVSPFCAGKGV